MNVYGVMIQPSIHYHCNLFVFSAFPHTLAIGNYCYTVSLCRYISIVIKLISKCIRIILKKNRELLLIFQIEKIYLRKISTGNNQWKWLRNIRYAHHSLSFSPQWPPFSLIFHFSFGLLRPSSVGLVWCQYRQTG